MEAGPALQIRTTGTSETKGSGSGAIRIVIAVLGGILLLYLGYKFYNYIRRRNGLPELTIDIMSPAKSSGEMSTPLDGKVRTVISASDIPSDGGVNYGVQYWMFIKDWDYRFGQDKDIVKRTAANSSAVMGPRIFLSPSENTLNVRVSLFPDDSAAGAASPGADTTGDSFPCTVENVPLQAWFSVSMTVFQRNLDVYINGRLVKSCVLPGIARPATGDMILNDNGGFSGTICNVNYYNQMLTPDDAMAFFKKGTMCAGTTAGGSTVAAPDKDSIMFALFGYTFRFSTVAKDGTELNAWTL